MVCKPLRGALPTLLSVVLIFAGLACDHSDHSGHEHGPVKNEDKNEDKEPGGHAHKPLYGGELIEIGEHFANLELVCNAKAGGIDIYVLDAHAENPLRPEGQNQLTVELQLPTGGARQFEALAVASSLTGETSESSAHFKIQDPALQGLKTYEGRVLRLAVKGSEFKDISFKISP
jgi:hypothetical protein